MAGNPEKPYIGVTGIARISEAETITQAFVNAGLTEENSSHQGMIGLLTSKKTLRSNFSGTTRHPSLAGIRRIFQASQGKAFNTVHYSTYHESDLSQQLRSLLEPTGLYTDQLCQGVQFNIPWPPTIELERIKKLFPNLKIIIQLGPRVLSENSPEDIVRNLTPYQELIDYSLIDPSGGRGALFEASLVVPIYRQIRRAYPTLPIVFAGGFDAKNVSSRLWLLSQAIGTRDFSIDAEEGLRVRQEIQTETILGTFRTTKYISRAALFFRTQVN